MSDLFANPLKQKVFIALQKAGLVEPRVHFPWIASLTDQEALKALKELGVKPELIDVKKEYIKKNIGGIVSLNQLTRPIGYR